MLRGDIMGKRGGDKQGDRDGNGKGGHIGCVPPLWTEEGTLKSFL